MVFRGKTLGNGKIGLSCWGAIPMLESWYVCKEKHIRNTLFFPDAVLQQVRTLPTRTSLLDAEPMRLPIHGILTQKL